MILKTDFEGFFASFFFLLQNDFKFILKLWDFNLNNHNQKDCFFFESEREFKIILKKVKKQKKKLFFFDVDNLNKPLTNVGGTVRPTDFTCCELGQFLTDPGTKVLQFQVAEIDPLIRNE